MAKDEIPDGATMRLVPNPECSDYVVAFGVDEKETAERVRLKLEEGWLPLGQPFVFGKHICQAMIRRS